MLSQFNIIRRTLVTTSATKEPFTQYSQVPHARRVIVRGSSRGHRISRSMYLNSGNSELIRCSRRSTSIESVARRKAE